MIEKKYGLENVRNLKTKHIHGIFSDLRKTDKAPTTLASYATAAREIACAIGKENIVPRHNKELGASRAGNRLKPVMANTTHIKDITEQLYQKAEWLGLAAEMRAEFGLRAQESLLSHEIENNRLVVKGAKGGRPRFIGITTSEQLSLIKRVKDHLGENNKSSLIPSELTLKQGLKKQSNTLHRLGATKRNRAHAHASRHNYAQQLSNHGVSRNDISQILGHGREEVVSHYLP